MLCYSIVCIYGDGTLHWPLSVIWVIGCRVFAPKVVLPGAGVVAWMHFQLSSLPACAWFLFLLAVSIIPLAYRRTPYVELKDHDQMESDYSSLDNRDIASNYARVAFRNFVRGDSAS